MWEFQPGNVKVFLALRLTQCVQDESLKDKFAPNMKIQSSQFPLALVQMESRRKFCSPQNISGALQQKQRRSIS